MRVPAMLKKLKASAPIVRLAVQLLQRSKMAFGLGKRLDLIARLTLVLIVPKGPQSGSMLTGSVALNIR